MPIYFFVSENGTHLFPPREEITLLPQQFQLITWDSNTVEATFGDSPGQIYWKDVAKAMGCSDQKPHDRFLLKTRFYITDFLRTCSTLNLSPFAFLIDPNRPATKPRAASRRKHAAPAFPASPAAVPDAPAPGVSHDTTALLRDMAALRDTLAAMEARCAQLEARVATLETQYKTLLTAHNTLARRVNVSIDTINNSYLSIAAEPEADYQL